MTSDEGQPENIKEVEEQVRETNAELISNLSHFVKERTADGLFPAVAYGLDPQGQPDRIGLITASIPNYPIALQLVERAHGEPVHPGRFVPLEKMISIGKGNAGVIRYHVERIQGLNSQNAEHRKIISQLLAYCTASRWHDRAFVLVDIEGFSLLSTSEQLSQRMSLGHAIEQTRKRIYHLHREKGLLPYPGFNRISTGDGFYIWSYGATSEHHVLTFVLMTLLIAQWEAMHAQESNGLQLRAGFAIGEAYTFPYHGPSAPPPPEDLGEGFMPDAIGPVLNQLERLLSVASPGQILVAHFDQPGRQDRPDERLDVDTMPTRIQAEILPAELGPQDPVKAQDIVLQAQPPSPLRVTDKHGEVHHCYNVWGVSRTDPKTRTCKSRQSD